MKSLNNHIIELDSWRGIMAILVAIFHYTVPNNFISAELAVDFFFILSGIVVHMAYFDKGLSVKDFFIKRLVRLYPLHLFSLFIICILFIYTILFINYPLSNNLTLAFEWQFPNEYYKDGILFTFLQQIFFIQSLGFHPSNEFWNGASWSVSAELWVNLIFFIWMRRLSNYFLLIFSFILYTLLFVNFGRVSVHNEYILYINSSIIRCLAAFCIGCVLFRLLNPLRLKITNKRHLFYSYLQSISIFILFYVMVKGEYNYNEFMAVIAIIVIISVSFLQLDTIINRSLKIGLLKFLGKISYSIYLTHYIVQYILQTILNLQFDTTSKIEGGGNLLIFIFMTIFISYISYNLVEKNNAIIMKRLTSIFEIK
ncbi:hypothetical protein P375_03695 [Gallibacterium genomosp. 2]|uniref:Acyltransferase 3 domain-containing protein n=1 Tax=Gallibacterium genomosp. 2 TaxID=155517 RepID=A0A0A2XQR2_9PAST|nr:acyltransferase [Gallibacterium genomosp. 2]KGQ33307.1 hypothetical protein P375_03695 [Gallibacterium genomosp. 2]